MHNFKIMKNIFLFFCKGRRTMRRPSCGQRIDNKISPELKMVVIKLYGDGYSCREIQKMLNDKISFSSISRLIQEVIRNNIDTLTITKD